jgi:ABC-type branched-subunit amino acid transport system substrate-binding protein
LLTTACGARLTGAQKQAGIDTLGASGSSSTTDGGSGPAAGPSAGPTAGGPGGPVAGPNGPGGPGPAASVPPGGNGGATDTGVTANEITITTASDISGVQAGLFKSTHQAMQAFTTMINYQGGLYGRRIKWIPVDTKADTVANQAAVREACGSSFALVGSMSAFDNGGASTGERCGIPDLTAIPVNPARQEASNVYAANPLSPHRFAIGQGKWIANTYGKGVIEKAAMLYLNAGVTKVNAQQRMKAYETVGFKWTYVQEVQVLEANYSPFVQKMKEKGIKYVNMVANYQAIQKLLNAMEQNEYYPQVRDWDSVAYSPNFLTVGKPAEGSLVFLTTAISEEMSSNPEMQLYAQWLSRVAPGAKPDYFGFYAWSAGRLFVKVHEMVGAKITRKKFFEEIKKVHSWNGNGLHATHDIGNRIMSPCFLYVEIRGNKFVRKSPSSGFNCTEGGIIRT